MLPLPGIAFAQEDGVLRIAIPSNLNTLDPARTKIGEEYIVNNLVFSALTEITADGEVLPDLAESWSANETLTEWTFELRDDVTFHDGSRFDAEDVKATIERVMDPETASTARVNFAIVESIDVIDDDTIRFVLNEPYAGFPDILGDRHVRIVPSELDSELTTEPVGTGPFRFVSFQPGNRVTLERNDDYYIDGQPKLNGVVMQIIPERSAQIAALETGEVHLLWDITPEMVMENEGNDEIIIDSIPTSTWDGVIMNAAVPPFDDQRVRKAIAMALDKTFLTEVALFGTGTPTNTMIPPNHPFYNDALDIQPADLDGAKELLAEAGLGDGFDVTLYVPAGRPTRERLGVAVAESLAQINVNVEVQRVPWDRFISEIEGKAGFFTDGFYSRPTLDTSIYPWYHSSGSWNSQLWHYENPEMDAVLDAARSARSDEERAEAYREFQRIAVEEPAGVIPYVMNHANAYSPRVQDFSSHPMMWLDLRNVSLK
ncbi:ABC transporter substrate-binding protein [Roseovarius sp. MBR-38]